MSDSQTATQHLEEALQIMRQETAQISVQGRALTPEEQERLEALSEASQIVEGAIQILKETDPAS